MDFKSLPYKKKNLYLLGGTLFFLVVMYFYAFKKTFDLYSKNKELKGRIERAENAPENIQVLEKKLHYLNSRLNHYLIDSTKSQERVLEVVSGFCFKNHLTLKEFPQTDVLDQEDYLIETNRIVAEGDFINLIKLVYELEQKNKLGRLSSVKFDTYMDHKRKKQVLSVIIHLQNIKIKEKKKNEV